MTRERSEVDRVWQAIVGMVMDTRGDWRRKVAEATGLPFTRVRALKRLNGGPLTLRALAEALRDGRAGRHGRRERPRAPRTGDAVRASRTTGARSSCPSRRRAGRRCAQSRP